MVGALNTDNAERVGEEDITVINNLQLLFAVGYRSEGEGALAVVKTIEGSIEEGTWTNTGTDQLLWIGDERTYATFTPSDDSGNPPTLTAPTGVNASDGEFADRTHVTWENTDSHNFLR